MVLITSCLKLMLLPLKLRSIQSTQRRAPDLKLGGKYNLSKTKMKFAQDMDETLFSAISHPKNTTHRTRIYFTGSRLQENRKKNSLLKNLGHHFKWGGARNVPQTINISSNHRPRFHDHLRNRRVYFLIWAPWSSGCEPLSEGMAFQEIWKHVVTEREVGVCWSVNW